MEVVAEESLPLPPSAETGLGRAQKRPRQTADETADGEQELDESPSRSLSPLVHSPCVKEDPTPAAPPRPPTHPCPPPRPQFTLKGVEPVITIVQPPRGVPAPRGGVQPPVASRPPPSRPPPRVPTAVATPRGLPPRGPSIPRWSPLPADMSGTFTVSKVHVTGGANITITRIKTRPGTYAKTITFTSSPGHGFVVTQSAGGVLKITGSACPPASALSKGVYSMTFALSPDGLQAFAITDPTTSVTVVDKCLPESIAIIDILNGASVIFLQGSLSSSVLMLSVIGRSNAVLRDARMNTLAFTCTDSALTVSGLIRHVLGTSSRSVVDVGSVRDGSHIHLLNKDSCMVRMETSDTTRYWSSLTTDPLCGPYLIWFTDTHGVPVPGFECTGTPGISMPGVEVGGSSAGPLGKT